MIHRVALDALTLTSLALVVGFVVPLPHGDLLFALAVIICPMALIALGAARRGRLGPLAWILLALGVVLGVTILALLGLRGRVVDGPWLFGLPAGLALQLLGLFIVPLLITGFGYAWTFERSGFGTRDLEVLRQRFPKPWPPEGTPPFDGGSPVEDSSVEDPSAEGPDP